MAQLWLKQPLAQTLTRNYPATTGYIVPKAGYKSHSFRKDTYKSNYATYLKTQYPLNYNIFWENVWQGQYFTLHKAAGMTLHAGVDYSRYGLMVITSLPWAA